MQCPKCNNGTKVKETRGITRRRECLAVTCRHRFTTEEHPVAKVGITPCRVPLAADADAMAHIAELERENAALRAKLGRRDRDAPRVKTRKKQTAEATRPAAFFTRESLAPDEQKQIDSPRPPVWSLNLPSTAFGRIR
ncbi:hypothetical protein [Paraburkholderia bryophila]|uniref:NrdR family transcriptional regulator n=1 Tax=Paraburkholderia bryophila TaxID=420952 RepID=UPI00142DE514|nr:hypothetical protein [Paraburkholderia bryophila]